MATPLITLNNVITSVSNLPCIQGTFYTLKTLKATDKLECRKTMNNRDKFRACRTSNLRCLADSHGVYVHKTLPSMCYDVETFIFWCHRQI